MTTIILYKISLQFHNLQKLSDIAPNFICLRFIHRTFHFKSRKTKLLVKSLTKQPPYDWIYVMQKCLMQRLHFDLLCTNSWIQSCYAWEGLVGRLVNGCTNSRHVWVFISDIKGLGQRIGRIYPSPHVGKSLASFSLLSCYGPNEFAYSTNLV